MIGLHWLYVLAGAMFAGFRILSALDASQSEALRQCRLLGAARRSASGGDFLGDLGNGLLVLGLAAIAGFGLLGRGRRRPAPKSARLVRALGNKLFLRR